MSEFTGSNGTDIYTGADDYDLIIGKGGNDTLRGNGGNDTIAGNVGRDLIDGGDGNDVLFAGDQSDTFQLPYYNYEDYILPTLDTGSQRDTVKGGAGRDTIFAGYGDTVDGGDNDSDGDYLYISFLGGGRGVTADFGLASQTIGGGTIKNIENISLIQGTNFDDVINARSSGVGYSDFTLVLGMGGNDTLKAGYYTGTLAGGDGNDVVDGRASQYLQLVAGDAGDDILYTNTNTSAAASGGDGDDIIYANGLLHGDAGDDTIYVQLSSYGGQVFGDSGNDEIHASDYYGNPIFGGSGEDVVVGGTGGDTIYSDDANPDMRAEHDTLSGGGGDDILSAGIGDDVDGGEGNDKLSLSLAAAATGVTFNTRGVTGHSPFAYAGGTIQNVEYLVSLTGSAFADGLTLATSEQRLAVHAGDGNDVIRSVSSSVDVYGDAGDDRFISGAAADVFDGGAGIDLIDYGAAKAGVTVVLQQSESQAGSGGGDELYNVEDAFGSRFADSLSGNGDANMLNGEAGGDTLSGLSGADALIGGAGRDTLDGGADNDWLFGGAGRDMMTGGAGVDTFRFATGDTGTTAQTADIITDFSHTERDRINLSAIDAVTGTAAKDAFHFVGASAFSGAAGELRYEYAGHNTLLMGDTDGDGSADLVIKLTGRIALAGADVGLGGGDALAGGDGAAEHAHLFALIAPDPLTHVCLV